MLAGIRFFMILLVRIYPINIIIFWGTIDILTRAIINLNLYDSILRNIVRGLIYNLRYLHKWIRFNIHWDLNVGRRTAIIFLPSIIILMVFLVWMGIGVMVFLLLRIWLNIHWNFYLHYLIITNFFMIWNNIIMRINEMIVFIYIFVFLWNWEAKLEQIWLWFIIDFHLE